MMKSGADLLDGPILAVWGACVPVTDRPHGDRVERRDPMNPRPAVIRPEFQFSCGLVFDASDRGPRGQKGRSAGGLNDEIRRFPENRAAAPVRVEVSRDERQAPECLDEDIQGYPPTGDTELPVVERVKEFKPVQQACYLEVQRPGANRGIEGDFGYPVQIWIWNGVAVAGGNIDLAKI